MSSCWTFLLKRRRAFSRGSPSCSLTSAKYDYTSQLTWLDRLEFCSVLCPSQGVSCRKYIKIEVLFGCLILRHLTIFGWLAIPYFCHPYSFAALSWSTIWASSRARSRVISPSSIMPVSAIASASRPEWLVCQPISSQLISGVLGYRSVPNRVFSGYHSRKSRSTSLSFRVEISHVCSEKSA